MTDSLIFGKSSSLIILIKPQKEILIVMDLIMPRSLRLELNLITPTLMTTDTVMVLKPVPANG